MDLSNNPDFSLGASVLCAFYGISGSAKYCSITAEKKWNHWDDENGIPIKYQYLAAIGKKEYGSLFQCKGHIFPAMIFWISHSHFSKPNIF